MKLSDLDQTVGSDIAASATGDLQPVSGTRRSQQRVLRRLLTHAGDYLFHPDYGAGLPQYVGRTTDIGMIRARIRAHLRLEDAVAPSPEPVIEVRPIAQGAAIAIRYVDAAAQQPVSLSFQVNL